MFMLRMEFQVCAHGCINKLLAKVKNRSVMLFRVLYEAKRKIVANTNNLHMNMSFSMN